MKKKILQTYEKKNIKKKIRKNITNIVCKYTKKKILQTYKNNLSW